jgi:mRNA interferase MazF
LKTAIVPDAGDFVWLTFDPQAGREQAGRRPALVPPGAGATGVILADHLKSIDWKALHAEPLGRCTADVMDEVRAKLAPLLGY